MWFDSICHLYLDQIYVVILIFSLKCGYSSAPALFQQVSKTGSDDAIIKGQHGNRSNLSFNHCF